MAARAGGLAELRAAETEAANIVAKAREERKNKMKQAQLDAKKEIDEYRTMREMKLKAVQPEAEALTAKVERVKVETDRKLADLDAEYERNQQLVATMLLKVVMNIDNPHSA